MIPIYARPALPRASAIGTSTPNAKLAVNRFHPSVFAPNAFLLCFACLGKTLYESLRLKIGDKASALQTTVYRSKKYTQDIPTLYIKHSLEAGALCYVLKGLAADELVAAVYSLHDGKRYFSKQIADIAKYYL